MEAKTPRIYVACLAAYNNGILHGEWIDATQDVDDIWRDIKNMLAQSPIPDAEEHAIHDYDCFCGINLSEYEDIDTVQQLATLCNEHGALFGALYHYFSDADTATRCLEDAYEGAYSNLSEWAMQFMDDTGQLQSIPENLRCYFDYDAFARDCEMSGDVFTLDANGETHVFWSNF